MVQEFQALQQNNTWSLVLPSLTANSFGCYWVFKTKTRSDGSFDKRKAHLVAKGFHKQYGMDFYETFSLVIKPSIIRFLISIVVTCSWSLHQLDIENAFLHGSFSDDVYMQQPQGFINLAYLNYICKLNKVIYDLKQAPRAWFAQLSSWLCNYGFHPSKVDSSLFIFNHANIRIYILIYVDDLVLTSSHSFSIDSLVRDLSQAFPVCDLDALSYFLRLEVDYTSQGLILYQRKYINILLTKSRMLYSKPISSPMVASLKLSKFDSPSFTDGTFYLSLVGELQYLSLT